MGKKSVTVTRRVDVQFFPYQSRKLPRNIYNLRNLASYGTNLTLTFRLVKSQGINAQEICMKVTKINKLYRDPLETIEEQMLSELTVSEAMISCAMKAR